MKCGWSNPNQRSLFLVLQILMRRPAGTRIVSGVWKRGLFPQKFWPEPLLNPEFDLRCSSDVAARPAEMSNLNSAYF